MRTGWTALMYAVNKGNVLIVESLVEVGVDVDVQAPDGPVHGGGAGTSEDRRVADEGECGFSHTRTKGENGGGHCQYQSKSYQLIH